jgi:hypothetical protein
LNARITNYNQDIYFWPLKAGFADVEILMQLHEQYERKHIAGLRGSTMDGLENGQLIILR